MGDVLFLGGERVEKGGRDKEGVAQADLSACQFQPNHRSGRLTVTTYLFMTLITC